MMARLPFNDIDLLIVDEMGKNISGVGIDPNITGRNRDLLGVFDHPTRIKRLFVRDLTDQSKGNAIGIGLADITTKRLATIVGSFIPGHPMAMMKPNSRAVKAKYRSVSNFLPRQTSPPMIMKLIAIMPFNNRYQKSFRGIRGNEYMCPVES